MALGRRLLLGTAVALLAILCWQGAVGQARPGAASCPAGDPGLCLALLVWWCGVSPYLSLLTWSAGLLGASLVSGTAPVWTFLVGWPAWWLVRWLSNGQSFAVFMTLSLSLASLFRCAGKLLLGAIPGLGSPLTLSGNTLAGSLLAEFAPNALWLAVFTIMLGASRHRRDQADLRPEKRSVQPNLSGG